MLLLHSAAWPGEEEDDFKLFRSGVTGMDLSFGLGRWDSKDYLEPGLYGQMDLLWRVGRIFHLGFGTGLGSLTGRRDLEANMILFPLEVKARIATRGVSWLFLEAGAGYYVLAADPAPSEGCPRCGIAINSALGGLVNAGVMFQITKTAHVGVIGGRRFLKTEIEELDVFGTPFNQFNADLGATVLMASLSLRF